MLYFCLLYIEVVCLSCVFYYHSLEIHMDQSYRIYNLKIFFVVYVRPVTRNRGSWGDRLVNSYYLYLLAVINYLLLLSLVVCNDIYIMWCVTTYILSETAVVGTGTLKDKDEVNTPVSRREVYECDE
jgi:hypothetical protein